MEFELDEESIYYFTCPVQDKYITLFVGWLRRDLIEAFQELKEGKGFAYVKINVGEHLFINYVDKPFYLLNFDNEDIFEFAGDDRELILFPSGNQPEELDIPPIIDFPTYFDKGVEDLIDFRLGADFCQQVNGVWVPIKI